MLLLLALVSVALAQPAPEDFDGNQVFRVTVPDEDHINLIQELANSKQIDFWKPDSASQVKPLTTVDFHVKAEDVATVEKFLEQNEFHYESGVDNQKMLWRTPYQCLSLPLQIPGMKLEDLLKFPSLSF